MSELRARIKDFVRSVGIEIRAMPRGTSGFLPGLDIAEGAVLLDEAGWIYPGDLLHEAGHVAVSSPEERLSPKLSPGPADEMAAIAWSYAALMYLALPPEVVFHPQGYKGGSQALIEAFGSGGWVGVPMLAYYGMAICPGRETPGGPAPYPHMLRWLR